MAEGVAGIDGIQNEKKTLQCLNDCLASYLERVRNLEADNRRLENKIWNTWRRRDLRSETGGIISRSLGTCSLQILWTIPTSFCRLTIPFLLLMTLESSMRQRWPRKVIDDTIITWL